MENDLNSCLVIFEVMGLQFFSLKRLSETKTDARPSFVRALLAIFWLTVTCGAEVVFFTVTDSGISKEKVTAQNIMTFFIQYSMHFGMSGVSLIGTLQSFWMTPSMKRFYRNLKEIARIMEVELDFVINFKRIKQSSWNRLTTILVLAAVTHFSIFQRFVHEFVDFFGNFLFFILISRLLLASYYYAFHVIVVNRIIQKLAGIMTNIFTIRKNLNFESGSLFVVPAKPMKFSDEFMRKIKAVRKIYELIHENGTLINESNGWTVLMIVINSAASGTACTYAIFVILVGGLPIEGLQGDFQIFKILDISIKFIQKNKIFLTAPFNSLYFFLNFTEAFYVLMICTFTSLSIMAYCESTKTQVRTI